MSTHIATTVDFKLDDTDTVQTTSSPSVKRKYNETAVAITTKEKEENSSIILTNEISPIISSPDPKKRNILEECDLDPISQTSTTTQRFSNNNNNSRSWTILESSTSLIPFTLENSLVQSHTANTNPTLSESQQSISTLTDTAQPQADKSVISTDGMRAPEGDDTVEMAGEGGTSPENSEDESEIDMMTVLLDIRKRIHKMELKGEDMLTKSTMKELVAEMQKPRQKEIKEIKDALSVHGIALATRENSELALDSKITLTSTELKTHIDTTSYEYAELKTKMHEDSYSIKEQITTAQESLENDISQLRTKMQEYEDVRLKIQEEIDDMKENIGLTATDNPNRRTGGTDHTRTRTHMDDIMRRSILIEGVAEKRGEDLKELILDISDRLDINLYIGEISQIRRVGQYNREQKPRPIRVTFIGEIKRDLFLQHKRHLINSERFQRVILYPDDKPEVRKFKAHIRMASDTARKDGHQVWQHYNMVTIDGKKYDYSNYTELATDFPWPGASIHSKVKTSKDDPTCPKTLETLRDEKRRAQNDLNENNQSSEDMMTDPIDTDSEKENHKPKGCKRPLTTCKVLTQDEVDELIDSLGSRRSVQITKYGIGFYTGDCILSNHHKVKFVYNGRDHTSSEQAYFAECAIAAKDPDSFRLIMKTNSPRKAKSIGENIKVGPTWKYIKYDRMYDINYARFTQNEFLKERLLATRGFSLIEASTNFEWASGSRLYSAAMSSGTWKGDNRHGYQLVDLREDIYRQQQADLFHEQATPV